jgi:hypothetical protein
MRSNMTDRCAAAKAAADGTPLLGVGDEVETMKRRCSHSQVGHPVRLASSRLPLPPGGLGLDWVRRTNLYVVPDGKYMGVRLGGIFCVGAPQKAFGEPLGGEWRCS